MRTGMIAIFLSTFALWAADKKPGPAQSGNDVVEVIGSAFVGREEVTKLMGHDPGFEMIVVEVKVVPKWENKVRVYLDDFTLLSNKDGQRSQPLAPSQIAGKGALVVTPTGGGGVGIGSMNRGPIWGGVSGRPSRVGGDDAVVGASTVESAKATVNTGANEKDNPLLAVLKQKLLKEGETAEEVTGLLYFVFDGKHKLKDLDLIYKSQGGRVILDFVK